MADPWDARAMRTSKRAALYVRVSTSDKGQTVENQLQPLQIASASVAIISYRVEAGVAVGMT
jgi:hypothetical protein